MDIDSIRWGDRYRKDLGDIASLARSIQDIGLLHPVVVNRDGLLIAGRRRLAACRLLGWRDIPATIVDLDDLIMGEHDENVYRKDFSPSEAVAIGQALEPIERAAAKKRMVDAHSLDNFAKLSDEPVRALDRVAAAVGMSRPTYTKAKQVVDAADQDSHRYGDLLAEMDRTGKVDRAYRELRRRQRHLPDEVLLPEGEYRVIYADPPWRYRDSGLIEYGHAALHYPTLTTEEICALPVKEIASDDAVLFLWVTSPFLEDAFAVIRAWGFAYKTSFVWDKVKHNFGHYNSARHEFLLVCTRGRCTPDSPTLYGSVQTIERTRIHSEKPERFREIIDSLYTHGRRIELFARRKVEGWDTWGNDPSLAALGRCVIWRLTERRRPHQS